MRERQAVQVASQAALLGTPSERTTRSDGLASGVNRATVSTDGRMACLGRSVRPRRAPSRIRNAARRGSGAFPSSSQRWHQKTRATAPTSSTSAVNGLDNQSAPASSTNMSVLSAHQNAGRLPKDSGARSDGDGQEIGQSEHSGVTRTTQSACQAYDPASAGHRTLDPNV